MYKYTNSHCSEIFSQFNIIKIVTHLEVMVQSVKIAKSDLSSGDYGTYQINAALQIFLGTKISQCFGH